MLSNVGECVLTSQRREPRVGSQARVHLGVLVQGDVSVAVEPLLEDLKRKTESERVRRGVKWL